LPDEVDVAAQAVHAVHVRQLEEHDVLDAADRLQPNQPTNDEDDGDIQTDDAATNHSALIYDNLCTTGHCHGDSRKHWKKSHLRDGRENSVSQTTSFDAI